MKKILLTLAAATMTLAASAYTLETPIFWEEDFVEMALKSDYPTDGWLTLGNGAKPTGRAAEMYETDGEGPYFVIVDYGSKSIPMANTDFVGGAQADEWLISPEIEVPYNASSLLFTAYSYCPDGVLGSTTTQPDPNHKFKVMVSEGGTDRSDFTEILSNSIRNSGSQNMEGVDRICSINGYQGKKIRVAFVVDGSMQGLTGFSNMRWGQYILYVDSDLTPELAEIGNPVSIDYNIKVKAPETCPNLLAELYINDEKITETSYKKAFGSPTSYAAVIQRMQFKNVYTPTTGDALAYKIVLTPAFEGAVPSVIEGGIGVPKVYYKNNVVIEEMTGTGCGWCPRGIASLNYYAAKYPGSETEGRVINIGIHNTVYGSDPMAPGNERYTTSVAEINGSAGLPGCTMNRVTRGLDPSNAKEVAKLIAGQSHNDAKIVAVGMPEGKDGVELEGKKASVTFEVRNGYDAKLRDLNAAIVLLENDIKGFNREYSQHNYLTQNYNTGMDCVTAFAQMGAVAEMAPYFNPFTASGDLAAVNEYSPFSKMVYEHVSRGIFPSFEGSFLTKAWEADVPQTFTMEFELPGTILNIENTEVAVLVINNADRSIVASDIFPASKYTDYSGVDAVEAEGNIRIAREGNSIVVEGIHGSNVELYALDGTKLAGYVINGGRLEAETSYKGVVIVKVASDNEVKSAKLIF